MRYATPILTTTLTAASFLAVPYASAAITLTDDSREIMVTGSISETGGGSGFFISETPLADGVDFNQMLDQDLNAAIGDGIVIGRAAQNSLIQIDPGGFSIRGLLSSSAVVNDPSQGQSSMTGGNAEGESIFDVTLQIDQPTAISIVGRWETDGLTDTDDILFEAFGLTVNPPILASGSQDTFMFDTVVGPGSYSIFGLTQNRASSDPDINFGELEFSVVGQVIPEPGSFVLISLGGLMIGCRGRRRVRATS
ncbi:MAG: hypothetical protein AAGA25_11460 [Planctomycetota bacterium]